VSPDRQSDRVQGEICRDHTPHAAGEACAQAAHRAHESNMRQMTRALHERELAIIRLLSLKLLHAATAPASAIAELAARTHGTGSRQANG
jgi:hypothetical protein